MPPSTDRRRARELALQACYAHELSGNDPNSIVADLIAIQDEPPATLKFAEELFRVAVAHAAACDNLIKQRAVNWEFHRIAILDKLILRLALCEFLYFEDIPPKVSIDEAIEIAKKFSTEKSGRFVNGILDSILNDFRVSGRLHKKGRGLSEGGRKEE
ncbi:MAG: transcription antitermination factor NusB [bacterium]